MINSRMLSFLVTLMISVGISQSNNIQRHFRGISEYTDENGHRILVRRNPSSNDDLDIVDRLIEDIAEEIESREHSLHEIARPVSRSHPEIYEGPRIERRGGSEPRMLASRACPCSCQSSETAAYGEDGWFCCECRWVKSICFPAVARVRLETGTDVTMRELQIGQKVLTADSDGQLVYSEVRAFLKRSPHILSTYLRISTTDGAAVRLSDSHVIFMAAGNSTEMVSGFAKDVSVGDTLYVGRDGSLNPVQVSKIESLDMEGVYVPLTDHGTVIVDDVYTSCYASFDHSIAHAFLAPLRWWPQLFGSNVNEADGMPTFVHLVKTIGRWILPGGLQDRPHLLEGLGHMFS